jgi:hypothetical protein
MNLLTVREAMDEGCFKFVHLQSGEMRLFRCEITHSTMVKKSERAIGAGIASYWGVDAGPKVRIDVPYSETLNKITTKADCKVLAEMFGCRVEIA